MTFDPNLAAIRFGSGRSPLFDLPREADALLAELDTGQLYDVTGFGDTRPSMAEFQAAAKVARAARGTDAVGAEEAAFREVRVAANTFYYGAVRSSLARHVGAEFGFAARLETFWADHFTVIARNVAQRHMVSTFVQDAIRPHIHGSFSQMLKAVATHPMMLIYLEQTRSVGPESIQGKRLKRGLNENLAREMLELHTLGVGGPYSQTDVTELAELLTGLTYRAKDGFYYNPRLAEPGAETVLGVTYDEADGIANILTAIDDLAAHPQTAEHIARKIAAEFVADEPDPDLIDAMKEAFVATDGDLPTVYGTMLDHPAAWAPKLQKVKSPLRFITSSMRALGVTGDAVAQADGRKTRELILGPLRVMGQPWEKPNGPDGWPDESAAWVSAQGMAGRISWAMSAPRVLTDGQLPDPRVFVETALGGLASQDVIFAASAAEARPDGVGLVLASPAFQRS